MIIQIETMNGHKLFVSMRHMKDIIKTERAGGIEQDRFTNVSNIHTCTICHPDQIIAGVALVHGQALKFTSDVVHGTRVQVLVGVIAS
jgi:hypothetical protein